MTTEVRPPIAPVVPTYVGRTAYLATRHRKETVVGPALAAAGLTVEPIAVDTDRLGTFTREVPRPYPPLETAIAKARLGMAVTGAPLGIASEGSFGAHPDVPWLTVDRELVVLVDDEHDLVIAGTATSAEVVTVSQSVRAGEGDALIARAGLPDHALVVVPAAGPPHPIRKGLTDPDDVRRAIAAAAAVSPDGAALVETDLRAHVCASRRAVIAAAAHDLARRLADWCPSCRAPGWGPVATVLGLPCSWCGGEVPVPRAETWACPMCTHTSLRPMAEHRAQADPAHCPRCNP